MAGDRLAFAGISNQTMLLPQPDDRRTVMLVRLLGFALDCPNSLTLKELFEDLDRRSGLIEQLDEVGRFLFVDSSSNDQYFLGLIVSVKNQRKFCELQEQGGDFRVIVNNLKTNSHQMEFNFFVVNRRTGIIISRAVLDKE